MSSFNARVAQVKIANYNTPPQNLPQFQNPFLLLSDTEALNQILKDKGGSPNVPAVNETPYVPPVDMPSGLVPTNPSNPTGLNPADQPAGLVPTDQPESEPSAPISGGAGRSHPSESMPDRFANLDDEDGDMDSDAHSGPPPPDSEVNLNENVDDDEGHDGTTTPATTPSTPSTTIIPNSAYGAGNTISQRLNTMTSHYDGHTAWSLAGSNDNPNVAAVATHPPIVPATRLINHVGVSNSLISSLYDGLSASQRTRLTTQSRSATLLKSSDNPALQTLLPSNFRGGKQIQSYRIGSNGNVYAYAYGTGNHPIYIGNWRESYSVTNPPFNQPSNPNRGASATTRPPPVSTNLGNTGSRFNQP